LSSLCFVLSFLSLVVLETHLLASIECTGRPSNLDNFVAKKNILNEVESTLQRRVNSVNFTSAPFSWSACMLLKDDNRLLPEWLAYHYEILPLRRIIVGVDPNSKSSPKHILEEFKNKAGLDYTLWEYDDYFLPGNGEEYYAERYNYTHFDNGVPLNPKQKFHLYLYRQQCLITRCLQTLHTEGQSWTLVADPDEYLTFNPPIFDDDVPLHCTNLGSKERRDECWDEMEKHNMTGLDGKQDLRYTLPKTIPSKTFAHYLSERSSSIVSWNPELSRPCWQIPRYSVSSVKSETMGVPSGFDDEYFDTIQYQTSGVDTIKIGGKALVDVRKYRPRERAKVHMAMPGCAGGVFPERNQHVLSLLHYIGPVERFLARGKPLETFVYRQPEWLQTYDYPLISAEWIERFVKRVGFDTAWHLTQGLMQGVEEDRIRRHCPYPKPPENWTLPKHRPVVNDSDAKPVNFVFE